MKTPVYNYDCLNVRGGKWWKSLLVYLMMCIFCKSVQAQISLNVTNFGAKGDAVQFYVNTVSNSVIVNCTNVLSASDIGKTIELFTVGHQTIGANSYGVYVTNYIDVIATITNIVNGTNLYVSCLPQATRTKAFAAYGTDNSEAFNDCIAAVGKSTNTIINIPNGTYLCLARTNHNLSGAGYLYSSILVNRGGLHFKGESREGTVLLSKGAFEWSDVTPYGTNGQRGFLFEFVAPFTNDFPVTMESMTLDGGVESGYLDVRGISVNKTDGLGWDEHHSAILCAGVMPTHLLVTNVTTRRWRGEMFKTIGGEIMNGNVSIYGCRFEDGNATALNIYGSWDVRNNYFNNLYFVSEYYQSSYTNAAYFFGNFITNVDAGMSFNGASWSAPTFTVQSNVFYFRTAGQNGIMTMPAANLRILNNEIHCANYMTAFAIGGAGSQVYNGMLNSNILISGNSIYAPNKLTAVFSLGGGGASASFNTTICSNYVSVPEQIFSLVGGLAARNVSFHNNVIDCPMTTVQSGQIGLGYAPFILIESNNIYTPIPTYLESIQTNVLSYVGGPKVRMDYVATGNLFKIQDSSSNQIPTGAMIEIDNRNNRWASLHGGTGGDIVIQASEDPAKPSHVLSTGQKMTFHWVNGAWSTNAAPPAPPSNLRLR